MAVEIVVVHLGNSSLAGREQRFEKDRVLFGRDPQADVSFDNERDTVVSHRHAEITLDNGALSLRDLGSRNGTFVNQRKLSGPVTIAPGDVISFGPNGPELRAFAEASETGMIRASSPGGAGAQTIAAPQGQVQAPARPAPSRPELPRASSPPLPPPPRPAQADGESLSNTAIFRIIDNYSRRQRGGSAWPLTLLALAGSLGGGAALGYFVLPGVVGMPRPGLSGPANPGTTEEPPPAEWIAALGRLEPDGGVVEVGGITGDRVDRLDPKVKEGAEVKKGDVLAYLASYEPLDAEVKAAQVARADARKTLAETRALSEAQVKEAQAGVDEVQNLDKQIDAQGDQIRLLDKAVEIVTKDRQDLEKPPASPNLPRPSQDQITRVQMQEERAKRERKAAESQLTQLQTARDLKKKAAQARLDTARANQKLQEALINVDLADANETKAEKARDRAIIKAPRDGRILRVATKEGETLVGRPIVELGDTGRFRVVAEVYETEVRRVKPGQKAEVRGPALPRTLRGTVEEIAWTVKKNGLRDLNPMAAEDLRVVEVRIALDEDDVEANRELLSRLIGLQVHAYIQPAGGEATAKAKAAP